MKRNTANGKGYVGQVGGVGMAGKDSSGDNKPNKLPLTNVSLGSGDHDDDGVFFCLNMIYLENYKNTPSLKSIPLARGEVLLGKASDLCMLCTHGKDIHTFTICVCSQVIRACILCNTRHTVCL